MIPCVREEITRWQYIQVDHPYPNTPLLGLRVIPVQRGPPKSISFQLGILEPKKVKIYMFNATYMCLVKNTLQE